MPEIIPVHPNGISSSPPKAAIISHIYPLQDYLGADGQPEVKIRKGRRCGKGAKCHL
ncbi:MAG: hypothetical protein PUP90_00175 [Nostoc sp. S4]|nr:hypothetical protein [Nostoc sp. S4]